MDDHDLLIRVDQKVDSITLEIKNLRDDIVGRLVRVEAGKMDRSDFEDFKKTLAEAMANQRVEDLRQKSEQNEKINNFIKDHEQRVRSLERFVYIAIGVITVIDLIGIPIVLKYLL